MDNITMSLGIYFEVKDAEIYGGEGTVGYAATIVDISLSGLQKADFTKYAEFHEIRREPEGRHGAVLPRTS